MKISLLMLLLLLLSALMGYAHSGGTDKYGCHTNHKTGVYHCHNPKGGYDVSETSAIYVASAVVVCALVIIVVVPETIKLKYKIYEGITPNSILRQSSSVMLLPYLQIGEAYSNHLGWGLKVGASF